MTDLALLLDELAVFVRRFVVLTDHQAAVLALWIVHTHCFEAAETTPYLAVRSAEKRSGKTRLLEMLELLVARAWLTGRVSAAALARCISEPLPPTLLLDESDAAFKGDKEYAETLRGVLNTGYRRSGRTTLCLGSAHAVTHFSTFCPKAIAGIGNSLPDTVQDRSIPIVLQRKTRTEPVERFRLRLLDQAALDLTTRLEYLVGQCLDVLRVAWPELPDALDDRAQDVWEPLLAIAELAGGGWPERARDAAVELSSESNKEDDSLAVRLLADIRTAFDDTGAESLKSADLIRALVMFEEAPWGSWYGKEITTQAIAKLLKPHGIRTREIWVDQKKERGYQRWQFEEAWSRFLPPSAVDPVEPVEAAPDRAPGLPLSPRPTTLFEQGGSPEPAPEAEPTAPTAPTTQGATGAGEEACRYPSHRATDWVNDAGRTICGECHAEPRKQKKP